jgi:hypothetical protein
METRLRTKVDPKINWRLCWLRVAYLRLKQADELIPKAESMIQEAIFKVLGHIKATFKLNHGI